MFRPDQPGEPAARPAQAAHCSDARVDFADYLEAKLALDDRSLNHDVREACIRRLAAGRPLLRWLDVGTGTGAMVRRLVASGLEASLEITALDQDASLLAMASTAIAAQLERLDYRTQVLAERIEANRSGRRVRVGFQCRAIFEFEPPDSARYDLITAHGFMDVVPMPRAVARFAEWLAPGGMLYATLNYDGDTALFPLYRDAAFEAAVLAEYDASMERRRVQGLPVGGARSGRRLHSLLMQTGFDVIAYGSSDWNITPFDGRYRGRDADVLGTLLALMRGESERERAIDRDALGRWYAGRTAQIASGELGMIVHQLDLLATRGKGLTACA